MSDSRIEKILKATLGQAVEIEEPQSRIEELLIELKEAIEAGGGGGGTTNYNNLTNKPSIEGVTLQGDKTIEDIGGVAATDLAAVATTGSYTDLSDTPVVDSTLSATSTNAVQNKTVYAGLVEKVDKVDGMGLSQNSFTNSEKSKLANLENYDDTDIRSNKMDIPKIVSAVITESDAENNSDGTVCGYANDFAGISGTWVVIRTYTLNRDKTRKIQIAETSTGVRKTRLYNGEWNAWV